MFTVAIIGRPNVGKSTLFNRLTGTKHALVDDSPGVTRDVREGKGNLGPMHFRVLDTAGLENAVKGSLSSRMSDQSLKALEQADVVLMLVDGRAGITPDDRHFADIIRKSNRPAVLAVNKAEGQAGIEAVAVAHALGLGTPIPISAAHGEGMSHLYDAFLPFEKEQPDEASEDVKQSTVSIAIVGRPNAGKSTFINQLLGAERVLCGPEPGITRDSISILLEYHGHKLTLVDTAGMRKRSNINANLEKLSVADTLRSIKYAQVVVLMMDATQALEKQDLNIGSLVEQEGRALVLAVNKWDLVPVSARKIYIEAAHERMDATLSQLAGVPVVPLSAEQGKGLDKLMSEVFRVYETWNKRIGTGPLNRWLEEAIVRHQPPLIKGKRLKLRYMTQAKSRPPTFTLFANMSDADVPAHYLRYLTGSMREAFALQGVPIRLKVKKNKNPYEEK